jgi:hypothetical protein
MRSVFLHRIDSMQEMSNDNDTDYFTEQLLKTKALLSKLELINEKILNGEEWGGVVPFFFFSSLLIFFLPCWLSGEMLASSLNFQKPKFPKKTKC